MEMKFFLTNFLVTLVAYGLTSFVYPSQGTIVPRLFLMWAAPLVGTLIALIAARVSSLGRALAAEVLALYTVSLVYCVINHEKAIIETLQYVTMAYLLPGALLTLLLCISAKFVLR
jgi:hypothetical protein